MKKTILVVENFVHGSFDLERFLGTIPTMTVLRCRIEEEVMRYLMQYSVDIIILDPVLPKSFLAEREKKVFISKPYLDLGGVGLVLYRSVNEMFDVENKKKKVANKICKKLEKKPEFILSTHLLPEDLKKTGFTGVEKEYVSKPVEVVKILSKMADAFALDLVSTN